MSDTDALRAAIVFGQEVFVEHRSNQGSALDGGWLQETAQKHGLLQEVPVAKQCSDDCACAEYYGTTDNGEFEQPGYDGAVKCLRNTDIFTRASAALERVAAMEHALERAAAQFDAYAESHFAKKTEAAYAKGMTNVAMARQMREALGIGQ